MRRWKAFISSKRTSLLKGGTVKNEQILLTCALPYANGPLHLGFILEAVQGDIFARFNRLKGNDILFCCADDTHGTPIEVNAEKQGKTPEKLIAEIFDLHVKDLNGFNISFDSF